MVKYSSFHVLFTDNERLQILVCFIELIPYQVHDSFVRNVLNNDTNALYMTENNISI